MILLLTAGYGEGHNAAARGLHTAFTELGVECEVVDLFARTGGVWYEHSRRAYLGLINHAPQVWAGFYRLLDRVPVILATMPVLGRMKRALAELITTKKPRIIISVYPLYGYLIAALFPNQSTRQFAFHTIITDSITINSVWHRCPSDTFFVPNDLTARVMVAARVPEEKIRVFGFPVQPRFGRSRPPRPPPTRNAAPRVLFMVNAGTSAAPGIVARLLENRHIDLTVTVGRDELLRSRIEDIARDRPVQIHGWTEEMPELLMSHHLLIGKAGGAAVQEAIAARTPMVVTHVVPGQEQGNAQLLVESGCGGIYTTPDTIAAVVERLFRDDAAEWRVWERNMARISRPDAALQIAQYSLSTQHETASRQW